MQVYERPNTNVAWEITGEYVEITEPLRRQRQPVYAEPGKIAIESCAFTDLIIPVLGTTRREIAEEGWAIPLDRACRMRNQESFCISKGWRNLRRSTIRRRFHSSRQHDYPSPQTSGRRFPEFDFVA